MSKNKKSKKSKFIDVEILTEEQYEEYLKEIYGMDFIAGFTESGVPYGELAEVNCEEKTFSIFEARLI